MNDTDKTISPFRAYTLEETANLLSIHPVVLRRKLQEKNRSDDPFVKAANPRKLGKEWRFMGENLLRAMGSASFSEIGKSDTETTAGAASVINSKK